jgi:hypothetical protein
VHGADRTQRHLTSRSPGHRVTDLCDHPRSSAPGLLLLPRSLSLHAMPHLPPAHHETSKHDSPNETKVKEKQNKIVSDSNSNLVKSMTHHNQTKELTTWFLTLHYCRLLCVTSRPAPYYHRLAVSMSCMYLMLLIRRVWLSCTHLMCCLLLRTPRR